LHSLNIIKKHKTMNKSNFKARMNWINAVRLYRSTKSLNPKPLGVQIEKGGIFKHKTIKQ